MVLSRVATALSAIATGALLAVAAADSTAKRISAEDTQQRPLAPDVASFEEGECSSMLQVTQPSISCNGPWCGALTGFCKLFDSNNPRTMQKAFDKYTEYAKYDEGIKIAVTKHEYYEMYHGNVGRKLSEYLPQRLFAWHFDDAVEPMQKNGSADPNEVKVVRSGTITFNLGWWRRKMFWNNVVKSLPNGKNFPFSSVTEFDDCDKCPAKMVFSLKKGGLDGSSSKGWKIVDVALIKLA